jgi:hypothetical protein
MSGPDPKSGLACVSNSIALWIDTPGVSDHVGTKTSGAAVDPCTSMPSSPVTRSPVSETSGIIERGWASRAPTPPLDQILQGGIKLAARGNPQYELHLLVHGPESQQPDLIGRPQLLDVLDQIHHIEFFAVRLRAPSDLMLRVFRLHAACLFAPIWKRAERTRRAPFSLQCLVGIPRQNSGEKQPTPASSARSGRRQLTHTSWFW